MLDDKLKYKFINILEEIGISKKKSITKTELYHELDYYISTLSETDREQSQANLNIAH